MKILPTGFDGQSIRRVYDEDTETWWFSVIDVVQVLTESTYANRYWSDLKRKLAQEAGSEQPYEKIVRLKLTAPDGKQRDTDCAEAGTLLRIVQSVPSPKAEPMQEMAAPALSLDRARQTWQQHGRNDKWIQQRMTADSPVSNDGRGLKLIAHRITLPLEVEDGGFRIDLFKFQIGRGFLAFMENLAVDDEHAMGGRLGIDGAADDEFR